MDESMDNLESIYTIEKLEPIGLRVVGDQDPRELSEEQFRSSPELLFHGALSDFEFSGDYDYRSPEYYENSEGTQTLGEGFYTTDERSVAEDYSIVRQSGQETTPFVIEVLPYQARLLDLRAATDNTKNAPVPEEIFTKWYEKYREYYKSESLRENLPWYIRENYDDYMTYLNELKEKMSRPDLRVMLCTAPTKTVETPRVYRSPPWMKLFSNFMGEQGFDGLVYIEGGEGQDRKNSASYVFYNLEKVGTYESWHSAD